MSALSLETLLNEWTPQIQREFMNAVQALRSRVQIEQVTRMLAAGNIEGALRAVDLSDAAFRKFELLINASFEAAGAATADAIPPVKQLDGHALDVWFNVRNLEAEDWLRTHSAGVVKEIMDDQRAMLRETLSTALSEGANPRATALSLVGRIGASGKREGGFIGLTQSQAQWVKAYEAELAALSPDALKRQLRDKRFDKAIARAIKTKKPLTPDQITSMANAYRNRALRYRAETIAQTETLESLHTAQNQALNQALQQGAIKSATTEQIWRTAKDIRVRHTHRAMEGQKRPVGQLFESPSGAKLRYPGDPKAPAAETIRCRCYLMVKTNFYAGLR